MTRLHWEGGRDAQACVSRLAERFGERLQQDVPLARYTSARLGGPADFFLEVRSAAELAEAVTLLWQAQAPYFIVGGGSNLLVSDAGVRGVVVLNHARAVQFNLEVDTPTVWAEAGANFGALARQAAVHGLSGLEWAAGIPGTLGGAVFGNAGAHGSDLAGNLYLANILQQETLMQNLSLSADRSAPAGSRISAQIQKWGPERFEFAYRSSCLKRRPGQAVVLDACLMLKHSSQAAVQAHMEELGTYRRRTQPPGASLGSMFKNPPGEYAGRLIEAAGLKGMQIGGAQISTMHANFFINSGQATAGDIDALIRLTQQQVAEMFGVNLELEIERIGEW